jgi:hypothetical protein
MKDSKNIIVVFIILSAIVAVIALIRFDTTGEKGSGLQKEFVYDINELTQIDPNLILYEESTEPISTGLSESHGIAVDSKGSIYVCGDKAIRIFTPNGNLLNEIVLTDSPRCIATTEDGTIYVGLKGHIETFDSQGKLLASWESLGDDALLTSIAVTKSDVFVADAGNRIIVRYDTAGKIINRIGEKDSDKNVPGLVIPSPYFDIAISKDGLLRVVNPGRLRIDAYTFDGDYEFSWGEPSVAIEGFCGCCNPANFAVLPDGGFVTSEKGLIRIKVYNSDGGFVGVVAGHEQLAAGSERKICQFPEECQKGGFDVAVDEGGRIFVLDTIKNVIRKFSKKGN